MRYHIQGRRDIILFKGEVWTMLPLKFWTKIQTFQVNIAASYLPNHNNYYYVELFLLVLQAQQILSEREVLDTVNSKHFYTDNNFPEMVLTIPPLETFKMGSGIEDDSGMRVVSFLYNEEVKDLFPGGKRGDNNRYLVISYIVKSSIKGPSHTF